MHKVSIGFLAAFIPALNPKIAEQPLEYALYAVGFAAFGGFIVLFGEWAEKKITPLKAFSELLFSVAAGFVAYWAVVKQDLTVLDAYIAALICGMSPRAVIFAMRRYVIKNITTDKNDGDEEKV